MSIMAVGASGALSFGARETRLSHNRPARRSGALARVGAALCVLGALAGCTASGGGGSAAGRSGPPTVLSREGVIGPGTQSGAIAGATQGLVQQGQPATIALLAPIGSSDRTAAGIGRALEQAARMAVGDIPGGLVRLAVYDTGGQPMQAQAAAERAAAEGASLIIGPLFAGSVRAAAPVAAQNGLNMLAFSTDPGVAGGNVFLVSFLAEDEIERVVDFASGQGVVRYGAMAPTNALGEVSLAALRRAAASRGGEVVVTQRYQQTFQGIEEGARSYATAHEAESSFSPIQAVLLADQGQALQSAAAYLAYFDVSPTETKFFGPGTWNDASSRKEIALRGGWFAGPDQRLTEAFERRFEAVYGMRPHNLASLAYDAVAAAAALVDEARQTGQDYPFTAQTITDPSGFRGANGVFRFRTDGLNDRGLAVYEVREDAFVEIDRAPVSFAGL